MTDAIHDAEREAERAFHDAHYAALEHPLTLDAFVAHHRPIFTRPYWTHGHPGGVWCDAAQRTLWLARPKAGPSGDWRGTRVLDVACGTGYLALWLAVHGADADGIELSGVGAAVGVRAAARYGLGSRCRIIEGSAEALPYPGATFDVVLGLGALHHLVKYPRVAEELARVTRSDGVIVFQETWWENPILRALRARFTQFDRDAGDAQLTRDTLEVWAGGRFSIHVEHRTLLYAAKRGWHPPRGRPTSNRFLGALKWVDEHLLLPLPGLRRWGAEAVVVLEPTGSHQRPDRARPSA